ncbi:MAG: ribosome small subunit-dependent GTPase A [Firmicutes bacterium]|nr:ribosome small subunit-dependent GTPase A [Bacillota bacterium]MDD4693415.1 ribosome small subunit-dependent GTPase A [Bacillota bacterium]
MKGVVVKVLAGVFTVNTLEGKLECSVKGRLKLDDYPTVGDVVELEISSNHVVITRIMPRLNLLDRPKIANVNQMFIFMATSSPEPNNYLIDRLTVLSEYWQLKTIIGFNKLDLKKSDLAGIYRGIGYDVYEFSLLDDAKSQLIRGLLKDKTTVLAGPSGVGKTTFVNKLLGYDRETADVSEKTQRGKHTTRVVELLQLPEGGYIADTPGFSRLDVLIDDPKDLSRYFREYQGATCRFANCMHLKEPGCSKRDNIHPLRFQSYRELLKEIEEMKPW